MEIYERVQSNIFATALLVFRNFYGFLAVRDVTLPDREGLETGWEDVSKARSLRRGSVTAPNVRSEGHYFLFLNSWHLYLAYITGQSPDFKTKEWALATLKDASFTYLWRISIP